MQPRVLATDPGATLVRAPGSDRMPAGAGVGEDAQPVRDAVAGPFWTDFFDHLTVRAILMVGLPILGLGMLLTAFVLIVVPRMTEPELGIVDGQPSR